MRITQLLNCSRVCLTCTFIISFFFACNRTSDSSFPSSKPVQPPPVQSKAGPSDIKAADTTPVGFNSPADSQGKNISEGSLAPQDNPQQTGIRNFVGTDWDEDWMLDVLATQNPKSFRSVGNTSVVFKMSFKAPLDAAFKPKTRENPSGYVSEIAAYRLARLLDLNNVPPAISRRINRSIIKSGLIDNQTAVWDRVKREIKWTEKNTAIGAAIYWVPMMRNLNIESRQVMQKWQKWLSFNGLLPKENVQLAKDISNTLCFDYLIGNSDRFSGGNLKGNPEGSLLYIRDHDMAFPKRLSLSRHKRIARRLNRAERFSRRFYRKIKGLTPELFQKELAKDPAFEENSLLNQKQLSGLFDRREALLSHIVSLIALHGVDRVLVFP